MTLSLPGYCPICKANVPDVRQIPDTSQGHQMYEDALGHQWFVIFVVGQAVLRAFPGETQAVLPLAGEE